MSANCSWIIILISIERWFAVCKPWQKARLFTNKRVALALLCIFLSSLILFIYFPFSLSVWKTEKLNTDKATIYEHECRITHENVYNIFGLISVLLVYIIPYFVLGILNAMVIMKLRKRSQPKKLSYSKKDLTYCTKKTRHGSEKSNFVSDSTDPSQTKVAVQVNVGRTDRSLSITLVTVAITFIILTLPFQALWFYENFFKTSPTNEATTNTQNQNATSTESSEEIGGISFSDIIFITKNMNYLINFVLYSALSKMFRQEFIALLTRSNTYIESIKKKEKKQKKENSSIANISFSMAALKNLTNGNRANKKKYIQIKIAPSYIFKYFKTQFENQVPQIDDNLELKSLNCLEENSNHVLFIANNINDKINFNSYIEKTNSMKIKHNKSIKKSQSAPMLSKK